MKENQETLKVKVIVSDALDTRRESGMTEGQGIWEEKRGGRGRTKTHKIRMETETQNKSRRGRSEPSI